MGDPLIKSLDGVIDQFGEIELPSLCLTDYEYLRLLLHQINWDDHNGNDTLNEALASLDRMNALNEIARQAMVGAKVEAAE